MPTARRLGLAALVLLALAAGPALSTAPANDGGPVSRRGTYAGGRYLIEVPAGWNGGLVLYAHGFRGTLDSPLTSHLLDRGYALAASSYRAQVRRQTNADRATPTRKISQEAHQDSRHQTLRNAIGPPKPAAMPITGITPTPTVPRTFSNKAIREQVIVVHFPFGPRGSTVSADHIGHRIFASSVLAI